MMQCFVCGYKATDDYVNMADMCPSCKTSPFIEAWLTIDQGVLDTVGSGWATRDPKPWLSNLGHRASSLEKLRRSEGSRYLGAGFSPRPEFSASSDSAPAPLENTPAPTKGSTHE
jgi:hypothetical protein